MKRHQSATDRLMRANWQRELEGAYLYRRLAGLARTSAARQTLSRMAAEEDAHATTWGEHVRATHATARPPRPDLRVHLIVWLAHWLGAETMLGLLLADELGDIAAYAEQASRSPDAAIYGRVLRDETAHARALASMRRPLTAESDEPWHRSARVGGLLRDVVYGFNDGLTANFGLVMGVIGASVSSAVVLLAGFAGLLADAFSMAASGFLAARSEQEVRQHHLALERAELRLMPEEERLELARAFERKGLTAPEAAIVANRLMQQPEVALSQLAQEELGINVEERQSPLQEGVVTGIATGLGAVIPILPFIVLAGAAAVWAAIVLSMITHFLVGASRAIFTGRPAIRSGLEMFAVGMGVALATYLLGLLVGAHL
jgi:VIT1/CCC1 family predicted Fe2+/Mn2+ transporter/rubrerythrin